MIRDLDEPDPGAIPRRGFVYYGLHKLASDPAILGFRIDRYWPDASNWRAEVNKVAAQNAAIVLCDDTPELGMLDQHGSHVGGYFL
jgi:hypothetical protein